MQRVLRGVGRGVGRGAPTAVLRGFAAAGVLLSGVVHLSLYLTGFSGTAVIGPLFLANAAGALVIAIGVLAWRHWVPAFLAAGFGLVTVVAYWISVTHGLFGVKEVVGGWPEILAETAEYVAIVCGAAVVMLLRPRKWTRPWTSPHRRRRNPAPNDPAADGSGVPSERITR